jgi:hypothetical protein
MPKSETTNHYYSFDLNELHIVSINSNLFTMPIFSEYKIEFIQWFTEDLFRTFKPWRVVMMHHSLYCFGEKDNICGPDTIHLREELEELFIRLKVNLVLTGHKHNSQRSYPINKGKILIEEPKQLPVEINDSSSTDNDESSLTEFNDSSSTSTDNDESSSTSTDNDESSSTDNEQVNIVVNTSNIVDQFQFRYDNPIGPVYMICGAAGNGFGLEIIEDKWRERTEVEKVSGLFGFVQGMNASVCEINAFTDKLIVKSIFTHTKQIADSFTLKQFKQ